MHDQNFRTAMVGFWHSGKHKRVPSELEARLLRKMDMLNRAAARKDLQAPPANRLHTLHGDREGQGAISVSGSWRLCFRFGGPLEYTAGFNGNAEGNYRRQADLQSRPADRR